MCVVCLSDVPVLNGLLNSTETIERHVNTSTNCPLRLEISDVRVHITHITDRNNDFSSVFSILDNGY